jgi:3-hydroxybutyryl-CoA dehydrogenase
VRSSIVLGKTTQIGVVGAGTLGAQIAFTMAAVGRHRVKVFDESQQAAERARKRMPEWLKDIKKAPSEAELDSLLTFADSLEAAVTEAELVIEAVPENLELKREIFARISRITDEAILGTNSSSIRSRKLADVTVRPQRLLNTHFFMEPWKHNVVELMTCGQTEEAVITRTAEIMIAAKVEPIRVRKESTGFLYNRIWRAVKKETLRVVAEGVGEPEEVDRMWRVVMGGPAGPCETMDAIGLDVVLAIERLYAEESGDPNDYPPVFLEQWVNDGRLGQKSGRGFYQY